MAMFVVLGKLTDQGAKNVRNLHQNVKENMARGERLGIKIHGWYLTQGQYDFVVLAEAPDAETMLAQSAGVAGIGNSRSETLRAYTLDEADKVLQKLGSA
jgi:uncharacterized protein with GYD domain